MWLKTPFIPEFQPRKAKTDAAAIANFEAIAQVSDATSADDIETVLQDEVQEAINDGNEVLLGTDSFYLFGKLRIFS